MVYTEHAPGGGGGRNIETGKRKRVWRCPEMLIMDSNGCRRWSAGANPYLNNIPNPATPSSGFGSSRRNRWLMTSFYDGRLRRIRS